jgi:acyl carrier protein
MEQQSTLTLLTAEVAKVLNRESVDPDIAVGELGVDSMRVVELILICDQLYSKSIDPDQLDINQFTTLRELDRQFREMATA